MPASILLHIDDVRIKEIKELVPPSHVLREFPATERAAATSYEARQALHRILYGADDRLLVIIGPCSIHDYEAAMEYARLLKEEARPEHRRRLREVRALQRQLNGNGLEGGEARTRGRGGDRPSR